MKKKLLYGVLTSAVIAFASCENGDNEFDNFDYSTVKFSTQYAARTVELGDDNEVDLTDDNNHIIRIQANWGGGYSNGQNVAIDYVVDPALCEGISFYEGEKKTDLVPMPASYYELKSDKIYIPSGKIRGGVEVKLTDAFFADPKSVENYYVIPLRMTGVQGADSILSGKVQVGIDNPSLTTTSDWSVQPKNYVLYAVKFVNPYHGLYARRGVDVATINGQSASIVRHEQYVEKDEAVSMSTKSLTDNILPITVKDASGVNHTVNVHIKFAADGTCTLSTEDAGVTVSGTGKFVKKGEKNSLGGKDRDALYLDYQMDMRDLNMKFATKDTLVMKVRNVYGAGEFKYVKE